MPEIRLLTAEKTRSRLTIQQQRYIKKLYQQAVEDVKDWEKSLQDKDNVSSVIRREYLNQMRKDLNEEMEKIGSDVESTIKSNISATATAVVKDANSVLNGLGVSVKGAYSFVPSDVVQAITTGQVYDASWTLSKAIWAHTKKSQQDIYDIIAKGVAENKSSYEIAKQLEIYVNPSALKPWDWGKLYPGSSKVVDYNAQRLARTLVSHAYQQSFVRTTKDNPFFLGYRWLTSGHNVCPICIGYAEDVHDNSLPAGVFPKDELPIDHPNGRCTFSVYMEDSTDQIVDSLVAWAHGEDSPELDKFAESLYPKEFGMVKEQVKLSTTTKNNIDVLDLPEVTISQASEDWFEYENANLMSEYIRDGIMPNTDINGGIVGTKQQNLLKSEALILQEHASSTITNYKTVYRGMVLQSEESIADFARNSIYDIETLTATSTSKDVAMIYTNTENYGGGIPVLLEIENPKGIRGFDRDGVEVVLPKGSSYRVSQSFYDEDGLIHVRLYAGKNLG